MDTHKLADATGREQARADYGTNGGSSFTRSATIPSRSDDVLVHSTEYNNDGEGWKTIDPAARDDRETYDDAGRRSERVENWKASPSGSDENVTTRWAYTPDGNVKPFTAVNSTTGDQVTKYVYGTTLGDSGVARSDLLRAEIYPDSDDVDSPLGNGADGIYDRIEYEYNRQGEMTKKKDQNETVHAYDTDKLARQTHDRVTTLGSGIDGAVRRISTTYEVRGLVEKVTSYDNATVGSGSIVNEIQNVLNDFGQTTSEYQSHSGTVVTGTTLRVQYAYADGSNNHVRQTSLTYPNGRVITHDFGSSGSIDDVLSRVRAIKDGTLELAAYSYLGAGFFVQVDYTEPDIRYDLATGGGNDPYDGGLDRFDRIIDLRWINYATSTDVERLKYGYDRAENRLWMERLADTNRFHDELYTYDGFNRLKTFKRGTVNSGHTAMTTLKFAQEWGLDATGNWSSFKEDSNGDATWDLVQTRTSNKVNEITDISETAGPSWATPVYNKPGCMSTVPKPAVPTGSFTGLWDAWERLVKLSDGANTVAEYSLDGEHRRAVTKSYTGGVLSETRHHYLTVDWRHTEDRVGASSQAERHWVLGNRYIDDLILRDRDTNGDGTLDERLYGLQGPTWNMFALSNAVGAGQERFRYAAYGDSYALTGAFADRGTSLYFWETRFSGYRLDMASSLHTVRRRFEQPHLGSWLSRDPWWWPIGQSSLLQYCESNPLSLADPMGLIAVVCHCRCATPTRIFFQDVVTSCTFPTTIEKCCGPPCDRLGGFGRSCSPHSWGGVEGRVTVCTRNVQPGTPFKWLIDQIGGQHTYVQFGKCNVRGDPLTGTSGIGFSGGRAPGPEKAFKPSCCYTLERKLGCKLKYGKGAGTPIENATDAQIEDCIRNVPVRKPYDWLWYNCFAWAKDAMAGCCLRLTK